VRELDQLGQHLAMHGPRIQRVLGDALEEVGQALGGRSRQLARLLDVGEQLLERDLGDGALQVLARGEVVEEGLLGHIGPLADVGHPGGGHAAGLEEREGGLQNATPDLALAALAAGEALGGLGLGHGPEHYS
jgi:hypothetical protein